MIFVNTSLDVAIQRNINRPRTIPEYLVKNNWEKVQLNIGTFQRIFSPKRMMILDNNRSEKELVSVTLNSASRFIRSQLNKKPENYIALSWIKKELDAKRNI